MKFIRVYNGDKKRCKHDYILLNVDAIDCVYLPNEEKGCKRVCVACFNKNEKRTDVFYYLGEFLDREKKQSFSGFYGDKYETWCWLDSNIAEQLYEELEMILNKE